MNLAERQAELLRALLADGEVPAGFDAAKIAVERKALRNKRRGVVAYVRPDLRQRLGERYRELFDTYAAQFPRLVGQRSRDDADAFEAWLVARGDLPRHRRFTWRWRPFRS